MARQTPSKSKPSDNGGSKTLELAISAINKQFGEGAIMRLGESSKLDVDNEIDEIEALTEIP